MSAALVDVDTTVLCLDMHRDALPYINMVRRICSGDVDPTTLAAIERLIEGRDEGRDVVVIIKPNLVAAVRELLGHNSSPTCSGSATDIADASTRTVGEPADGVPPSPGAPSAPSGDTA